MSEITVPSDLNVQRDERELRKLKAWLANPPTATGPKGLKGRDGRNGHKGRDGREGPPGFPGPEGDAGIPGPTGYVGAIGPVGSVGLPGPQGSLLLKHIKLLSVQPIPTKKALKEESKLPPLYFSVSCADRVSNSYSTSQDLLKEPHDGRQAILVGTGKPRKAGSEG